MKEKHKKGGFSATKSNPVIGGQRDNRAVTSLSKFRSKEVNSHHLLFDPKGDLITQIDWEGFPPAFLEDSSFKNIFSKFPDFQSLFLEALHKQDTETTCIIDEVSYEVSFHKLLTIAGSPQILFSLKPPTSSVLPNSPIQEDQFSKLVFNKIPEEFDQLLHNIDCYTQLVERGATSQSGENLYLDALKRALICSKRYSRLFAILEKIISISPKYKLGDLNDIAILKIYDLSSLIQATQATIEIEKLPETIYCDVYLTGILFEVAIEQIILEKMERQPKISVYATEDKFGYSIHLSEVKPKEGIPELASPSVDWTDTHQGLRGTVCKTICEKTGISLRTLSMKDQTKQSLIWIPKKTIQ